jgi:hypothetical protein
MLRLPAVILQHLREEHFMAPHQRVECPLKEKEIAAAAAFDDFGQRRRRRQRGVPDDLIFR